MKRIISYVLIFAVILSAVGCIGFIDAENVYARYDGEENRRIYQPTDDPIYYYRPPVDENGNHDYFGYVMYDDPQDIPDEEFFGTWDEIDNEWILVPYFRYSEFPDMADVEAAAKAGDYDTAKEELLKYYQKLAPSRADTVGFSTPGAAYQARLECMSYNIFAYNMISSVSIGGFEIPENEFSHVTFDVNTHVTKGLIGSYPEFSVEIASGDKYWTTAEIYSKEAEDKSLRPYLSAIVNGIYKEFEVSKDAMIVAGTQADNNFGTEPLIEVQEHGCFDNIDGSMNSYDETTKRMFIAFDISSIKSTDTVKNVKVHLTARNIITDETKDRFAYADGNIYEREADRSKLMWAVWYKDSAWKEDTITWNTNTVLDKLYFSCHDMEAWDYISSNSPSVKGKVSDFHRDLTLGSLRASYASTKDERYAYTYIRQEMALINSIGCEPGVMNSLDMSGQMNGLCQSFYVLSDSKYFTADVCTAWLKFMWQLCNWQVESYFGTTTNNWATFATSAVYNGVARFPEFRTHDYWYERVLADNTRCLSGMTMDDGLCVEQSHNYIATVLSTFATPMDTMQVTKHAAPYGEELYKNIYDCVKSLVYTSGPYFGGFNQGDGYDPYFSYLSFFQTWYQYLFSDDENLAWIISHGTSGSMPKNATYRYPESHKTFMRSGWDENSLQLAFVNCTDSRRSHFHDDALSFAMFAYGSYLLVDPGYGSDQTGDGGRVWKYNKSPVQHNTVTINDTYNYLYDNVCAATSIAAESSGERGFESNMYYDFQEYINTGYSSASVMKRSITFLKEQGFWIISDYNVPNDTSKENVFAQHWHTYPGANMEYDDNLIVRTNYDGPNVTIVPIESEELDGVEWVDCYYSEKEGMKVVAQKAMYTKTQKGAGRFTTLIIPEDIGDSFNIESASVKNSSGLDDSLINGAYFKITDENSGDENYYFYYHINDESMKPENGVVIGDYTTDATTLLVQMNSKQEVISVFVDNGSYIKDAAIDAEYMFKAEEPTTVSYKKSGSFVNILSSQYDSAEDIADMQIYMPSVKAARLESKDVKADIENGVITLTGTYGSNNISSGGGGGGGGIVSPAPSGDEKNDEEENNNGKEEEVTNSTPPVPYYNDVDENEWYFKYVKELTEKEIVSGDGSGNFVPNSNVTREQFIKMLMIASDVETDESDNTFADVLDDAWYKPYVLKAKNFGIVTGISDTEFGIGTNITRQDMAVMISRAAEKLGLEIAENDTEEFADDDKVSEYAKQAVMYMKSIGLIEGYNNEFRPLDNLTRAESAKVISELLQLIEENYEITE